MKNLKKIFLGVAILSQAAFAYQDVDGGSWEGKAVKQLYEKGILTPALIEKDLYEGEKTFSRYEIASLLYNTIKYNGEQLEKNIDVQDIIILKALIAEYGNELGELGAKNDELKKELDTAEKRINNRIDDKFSELKKELDKFRINGEVTLQKDMNIGGSSTEAPGYDNIKATGTINLLAELNDDIKGTFSFDPETGLQDYEVRLQDENINLLLFEDSSDKMKLPTFKSPIGLLSGDIIDEEDAVIARGRIFDKNYTAVLSSATAGDIFAFEWEGKYKYFDAKEGTNSNVALAYALIENSDSGDKREFISFAPNFEFTLSEATKTFLDFEYASVDNKNSYELGGDSIEYTLPAEDTSAIYLYDRTETIRKDGSKLSFTFAGVNTGVDYNIDGLGDTNKKPFRETKLVKLEANRMGAVLGTSYTNNDLTSSFYYSAYGSNNPSDKKQERYELSSLYAPKMSNIKYGIDLLQDESYDYNILETDTTINKRQIIMPKLYLNDLLGEDTENKIMYADINNLETDKKSWKIYADHTKLLSDQKSLKYVGKYYDDRDKLIKDLELGWNFERKNMTIGKEGKEKLADLLIGSRYVDIKNDSSSINDETSFRIFLAQEIFYGKWSFLYGAKYQTDLERLTNDSKLKDSDSGDNIKYGFEFEYNFSKDVDMKFVYGPADIYESNDEDSFLEDRTSAFDGEQSQASFSITAKF